MEPSKLEYLSEAELEQLIMEVEEDEMLQAPSYLKRETLQKIRRKYYPIVPIQKKNKKVLFLYRLKVGLATVAAILVLCVLPAGEFPGNLGIIGSGNRLVGRESLRDVQVEGESLENGLTKRGSTHATRKIKETSDQICQTLNEISGWLVSGEY